jgi:O-antigen ligase
MNLQIRKSFLCCFILVFPVVAPYILTYTGMGNRVVLLMSLYTILVSAVTLIKKSKKLSTVSVLMLLLTLISIISTICNGGLISVALKRMVNYSAMVLVLELYSDRIELLLKALLIHFEVYIYLNFVTVLLLPNGLLGSFSNDAYASVVIYILGWHHLFKVWFIPALLVSWLYKNYSGNNLRCYILSAVILITELKFGASTGLMGVLLLIIMLNLKKLRRVITPMVGAALITVLIVTIVFTRKYGYLTPILQGLFGGDMTFTGRLLIWDNAIKQFLKMPIIGHGILSNANYIQLLGARSGLPDLMTATHCHNHLLQIMFQTGIVGTSVFLGMYICDLYKARMLWKNTLVQICVYVIFVYTIIGITEQYEYALMYIPLVLGNIICDREMCNLDSGVKKAE